MLKNQGSVFLSCNFCKFGNFGNLCTIFNKTLKKFFHHYWQVVISVKLVISVINAKKQSLLTIVQKLPKLPNLPKLLLRKNLSRIFSTDYRNYQFYWNYHLSEMVKELLQTRFNYSTEITEITKLTEITTQKNTSLIF